jgi:hypothetical protein
MRPESLRIQCRLFPTAIGVCGIAWSQQGICAVQLPEIDTARTRARLLRGWPGARSGPVPRDVQRVIDDLTASLAAAHGCSANAAAPGTLALPLVVPGSAA